MNFLATELYIKTYYRCTEQRRPEIKGMVYTDLRESI